MMTTESVLFNRVFGCMEAGAVGDAVGFGQEGWHYQTIRRRIGRATEPRARENGPQLRPPVTTPCYTDDTVMKHMVCEAIFETEGRLTPEAIASVWQRRLTDLEHWHWWMNTRLIGAKLRWTPWVATRDLGRDSLPADDAAMMIGPVGIINAGDPQRAAREAWDISGVWQTGYSRECAAAMAAAHAEALRPNATVDSIVETARCHGPTLRPYIDRAIALAGETRDADRFTEQYYERYVPGPYEEWWIGLRGKQDPENPWCFNADPLEVCSVALAFFSLADGHAEPAIVGGANFGRDCDTIAGLAGALAGALRGHGGLPQHWIDTISTTCPEPDMRDYAQRLTELLVRRLRDIRDRAEEILTMV